MFPALNGIMVATRILLQLVVGEGGRKRVYSSDRWLARQ